MQIIYIFEGGNLAASKIRNLAFAAATASYTTAA